MRKTHNIPSFTLYEMIVVLGISGIVMALAFSVLRLTQQHMESTAKQYAKMMQWQLLEQSLRVDFNNYSDIRYDATQQQLRFAHAQDTVYYTFYTDKVIKARDTFSVAIISKYFYYRAITIDEGVLDAIALHTGTISASKRLFLFRKNDATPFLNSP